MALVILLPEAETVPAVERIIHDTPTGSPAGTKCQPMSTCSRVMRDVWMRQRRPT